MYEYWEHDQDNKMPYAFAGHLETFCISFGSYVLENPDWLKQGRKKVFNGVMEKGKGRLGPFVTRELIDEIFKARGL